MIENRLKYNRYVVIAFLLAIAVISAWTQWVTPYFGDDLTYMIFCEGMNWKGASVKHWYWLNGRISNFLLTASLRSLPHLVVAVLNAAVTAAWMWLIVVLAMRRRRFSAFAGVVIVTVTALCFAWWDSFLMLSVSFNYVWASSLGLFFLWFLLKRSLSGALYLVALPVAFLAGAAHEAQTASLLCGFAAAACVCFIRKIAFIKVFTTSRCALLAAFCAGALLPLSSPAFLSAIGADSVPDAPWWQLLMSSSSLAVILLFAVAVMALFSPSKLKALVASPWWCLCVVAAVSTIPIVLVGGIIGRSGWFGQTFALIALVGMVPQGGSTKISPMVKRVMATILIAVTLLHYILLAVKQTDLSRETQLVTEDYRNSEDGIVYSDAVLDNATEWYLLGRPITMPHPCEAYKTWHFSVYYGSPDKKLIVLPEAFAPGSHTPKPDGWEVVQSEPQGMGAVLQTGRSQTRRLERGGRRFVVTPLPGDSSWLISPWPLADRRLTW